jgi:L-threonylcarbamoyladenylate synthase
VVSQASRADTGFLRSPGMLPKHYSPKAKLIVTRWRNEADIAAQISDHNFHVSKCHLIAHTRIPATGGFGRVHVLPHDATAFARAIYAELHRCDEEGAELILVEAPPSTPEWHALADRLRRAAT